MPLSKFELHTTVRGGHLIIDGVDISDRVIAVQSINRVGEVPRLLIEVLGEGEITGLADVTIVHRSAVPDEFFKRVDPSKLEEEALARLEGFGDASLTQTMLQILAEWAGGR